MIHFVRGRRVMLDADLAALYGVATKVLNKSVRRNLKRFPPDFAFRLNATETANLRFQIGTSSSGHGGRHDKELDDLLAAIQGLAAPDGPPRKRIGFQPTPEEADAGA